ncbi:MAG: acyltransferase family protein, partial [Planctomycetota bacterium]|nr:acyltransferase family protein [Planctomycetota bacterium]
MPSAPRSFRKDHVPELDGLRGVAVLLVIWIHLPMYVFGETVALIRTIVLPGDFGVDLFFVLSGFLITRILLVDCGNNVPLRFFLMRR